MKPVGADSSHSKLLNSTAVLRVLYELSLGDTRPSLPHNASVGREAATRESGLTISELSAEVNVSRPTVEDAVDDLLSLGWLSELDPDKNTARSAGRPARRVRFRADAGVIVGVDVETSLVSAVVADLTGQEIARTTSAGTKDDPASERLTSIENTVTNALAMAGVPFDRVLGAAVGATGIVDSEGRIVLSGLPGWTGIRLADKIRDFLSAPVSVHNHLRLSAVGERWCGATMNADNVIHLHAGQRMALCALVDGKPVNGFSGAAGEVSPATAEVWTRAYSTLLKHSLGAASPSSQPLRNPSPVTAAAIFDAAAAGDLLAVAAAEKFALELIAGIDQIFAILNPEVVVLGGDLARVGDAIVEPVQRHVESLCPIPPSVAVSALGEDSILLGAIRVALDDVERRIFVEHRISEIRPPAVATG